MTSMVNNLFKRLKKIAVVLTNLLLLVKKNSYCYFFAPLKQLIVHFFLQVRINVRFPFLSTPQPSWRLLFVHIFLLVGISVRLSFWSTPQPS